MERLAGAGWPHGPAAMDWHLSFSILCYCRDSFGAWPVNKVGTSSKNDGHIDCSDYRSFDDALEQMSHWLEVEYMTERIHSALGYRTPAEFENAFSVLHPDSPLAWA